ncbi:lebercilin-like protein [Teleopsis dalmanni]|uniref:lebercilin-like protein n=1 Tax=Teleopsis dalmanni TaxID=139649 RepID=UPI0018CFA646|nr:lebercilin-like protein [Teleopsis dalmanni]
MISPQKTPSLKLISEEVNSNSPHDSKSCASFFSNASSSKASAQLIYGTSVKPHPSRAGRAGPGRTASLIPASTEVRKRVLSARRLRVKTFQNQLADAQQTISDLAHENRMLRTLHKRQDSALAKYESTNAELPQLLYSHAEEIRMWQSKYRTLQQTCKDLEKKIKQKEAIILSVTDQNKYFNQLNKDKNLESRQKLTEKVKDLQTQLQEKNNEMNLYTRKTQLEIKNLKQQIQNDQKQQRETMVMLDRTRLELSGLRKFDVLPDETDLKRPQLKSKELEDDNKSDISVNSSLDFNTFLNSNPYHPSKIPKHIAKTLPLKLLATKSSKPKAIEDKKNPKIQMRQGGGGGVGGKEAKSETKNTLGKHIYQQIKEQGKSKIDNQKLSEENKIDDQAEINTDSLEQINPNDDATLSDNDPLNGYASDNDMIFPKYSDESFNMYEHDETDENENSIDTAKKATKLKDNISDLRKMIYMPDMKRESFLDAFCENSSNQMESVKTKSNLGENRKNKLLAALKAIDDKKD